MKRIAAALSFLALAPLPALSEDVPAKGTFKSKTVEVPLAGAVAFRGRDLFSSEKDALIVAVSNAKFAAAALEPYTDRRRAIERRFKDDETAVVYLTFTPDGKWRGLSYYFGPGNGCGFCTSEVKSTVKLSSGKLAGSLKGTEKDRPFDVTLDVPVLSDDHGPALVEGGGDPGKAYLAYHAALAKSDANALKPLLPPDRSAQWEKVQKSGDLPKFVAYLRDQHGLNTVKVGKGWSKGDHAVLLIAGEGPAGPVTGEAVLVREKGTWRVDDELTDPKTD